MKAAATTTQPVVYLSSWRVTALIIRFGGVYLLCCAFWIGWHYALEFIDDLRRDYAFGFTQDWFYSGTMLIFLLFGMSVMLWIILVAHKRALRPLRARASIKQMQKFDRVLQL